tara:strand:+ start:41 stop:640 length:600 start_codon:yes stop_codon:yes gene_type:complete
MATFKRPPASYLAEENARAAYQQKSAANPFKNAKSLAAMKKIYSNMTAKQRGQNVDSFRRAAAKLNNNKTKPAAKPRKPPASTTATTTPAPKPQAAGKKPVQPATSKRNQANMNASKKIAQAMRKDVDSRSSAKPPTKKHRGGQRARSGGGSKKGRVTLKGVVKAIDKGLKLTYKEGDKKKVGNITYIYKNNRWKRYTM